MAITIARAPHAPVVLLAGVARTLTAAAARVTPPLAPGQSCPRHHEPVLADQWAPGMVFCPALGETYPVPGAVVR